VGDLLLQEAATRLKACLRQEDTVSRLGGDEFIMILPDLEGAEDAVAAARRIMESLAQGFLLSGHELFVTASLGITLFPSDGADLETLVKNADMALYRAKEEGRNNYQLYTPAMNDRVVQRLSLESALRKALDNGRIIVHYQPKVDLASGRMTGMEALARWALEDGTMVQPQEFIPLAEETGLIVPLGAEVLRQACRQTALWRNQGHPELTVAVNLSARQFSQQDLVAVVEEALRLSGLPASHLELEITESTAMGNVGVASETLKRLQAMGVRVSLDDFGTGYSSLYYLKQFPINALKIDKFFVQHAPEDPDDAAIVQAIVSMAHSLGLKIVAEGVETAEQLAFLRGLGCEMIQGFIFSRPLPAQALGEILAQGRRLGQE
jgi:predicted signal transduction protein with EAL and GGDEF domain